MLLIFNIFCNIFLQAIQLCLCKLHPIKYLNRRQSDGEIDAYLKKKKKE